MNSPQDKAFPQLPEALDANQLARCLQAELQRTHPGTVVAGSRVVRHYYKPGKRCRVLLETRIRTAHAEEHTQLYLGEILAAGTVEEGFRRAARADTGSKQPAAVVLRPLSVVLWAFPHDPNLPGLTVLADAAAMRKRIQRDPRSVGLPVDATVREVHPQLSKYVPGRRCGFSYRVHWRSSDGREAQHVFFGKIYKKGYGSPAFDIMRCIESSPAFQSGRLRTPRAYGYDPELEAVWQELVRGEPQTKNPDPAELCVDAQRAGSVLAAFHSSKLPLGRGLGMSEHLGELRRAVSRISSRDPESGTRCGELVRRLQDAGPQLPKLPLAPVHGSFKSGHILRGDDGVTVIDFDGAGLGDPMYDVGRYIARLEALGMASPAAARAVQDCIALFRTGYATDAPWGWPEERVRWYTSAHLISSQAHKNVKRMASKSVGALVDRAERWFPASLLAVWIVLSCAACSSTSTSKTSSVGVQMNASARSQEAAPTERATPAEGAGRKLSRWIDQTQRGGRGSTPPAGEDVGLVYDPTQQRVLLFGGKDDASTNLNETWELDPTANSWKKIEVSEAPPAVEDHTLLYDPIGGRMILYGGEDGLTWNNTWSFDLQSHRWTDITAQDAPQREDHTAIYDSRGKRMVVFGGQDNNTVDSVLWTLDLDPASPTFEEWDRLAVTGASPPTRYDHVATYDSVENRMLVFGGRDPAQKVLLDDVWAFSFGRSEWEEISLKTRPSARRHAVGALDTAREWWIVYGGLDQDGYVNDVWAFDLTADGWLNITPGPQPRIDHSVVYDPISRNLYLYGGDANLKGKFHDLWQLEIQPDLPLDVLLFQAGAKFPRRDKANRDTGK